MSKVIVDARGLKCPLPLLKLKQAILKANAGDEIELIAHDKGAWRDVPTFIQMTKHVMLSQRHDTTTNEYRFNVIKGEEA